jgi:hypothetical protein
MMGLSLDPLMDWLERIAVALERLATAQERANEIIKYEETVHS